MSLCQPTKKSLHPPPTRLYTTIGHLPPVITEEEFVSVRSGRWPVGYKILCNPRIHCKKHFMSYIIIQISPSTKYECNSQLQHIKLNSKERYNLVVWYNLLDYWVNIVAEKIWFHATFHIQVCNLCHYCISCHFLSSNYYVAPFFLLLFLVYKKRRMTILQPKGDIDSNFFFFKWYFPKQVHIFPKFS